MPLFVYRDVQWCNKVVYIRMLIVDEAEGEKRADETEEKLNNDSRGDTTDKRMDRPRCAIRILPWASMCHVAMQIDQTIDASVDVACPGVET